MSMHAENPFAEFTPQEGRKFGVTVGLAFLALATFVWWRESESALWRIFGGIGIGLFVSGLVIPGLLGPIYKGWMKFALLLSKVTTPIFMGIIYFVLFLVTGLMRRNFGSGNQMIRKEQGGSFWIVRDKTRANLERQF
jgi:hypothetical protein